MKCQLCHKESNLSKAKIRWLKNLKETWVEEVLDACKECIEIEGMTLVEVSDPIVEVAKKVA